MGDVSTWKVIVAGSVSFTLPLIAIVLRLLCKWKFSRKQLALDDLFAFIAFVFKVGISIGTILAVNAGIGKHITSITDQHVSLLVKTFYTLSFLYAIAVTFAKLSILCLYRRNFPKRSVLVGSAVTGVIVVLWCTTVFVVELALCLPVTKPSRAVSLGKCMNKNKLIFGLQSPNIITDVAILTIPVPTMGSLNMSKGQKVMLAFVYVMGVLTLAFDIIRLVALVRFPNSPDITYDQVNALVWTELAVGMLVVVSCLPTMRPLLHPRKSLTELIYHPKESSLYLTSFNHTQEFPPGPTTPRRTRTLRREVDVDEDDATSNRALCIESNSLETWLIDQWRASRTLHQDHRMSQRI